MDDKQFAAFSEKLIFLSLPPIFIFNPYLFATKRPKPTSTTKLFSKGVEAARLDGGDTPP